MAQFLYSLAANNNVFIRTTLNPLIQALLTSTLPKPLEPLRLTVTLLKSQPPVRLQQGFLIKPCLPPDTPLVKSPDKLAPTPQPLATPPLLVTTPEPPFLDLWLKVQPIQHFAELKSPEPAKAQATGLTASRSTPAAFKSVFTLTRNNPSIKTRPMFTTLFNLEPKPNVMPPKSLRLARLQQDCFQEPFQQLDTLLVVF